MLSLCATWPSILWLMYVLTEARLTTGSDVQDLSKVCLPVYFNEPTSALQKIAEELEYSRLLDEVRNGLMGPVASHRNLQRPFAGRPAVPAWPDAARHWKSSCHTLDRLQPETAMQPLLMACVHAKMLCPVLCTSRADHAAPSTLLGSPCPAAQHAEHASLAHDASLSPSLPLSPSPLMHTQTLSIHT